MARAPTTASNWAASSEKNQMPGPSGPLTYVLRFISGNANPSLCGNNGGRRPVSRNGVRLTQALPSNVSACSCRGSRLPRQLQADTFEGKAWVSLTPFLLTGLRPPLFPHRLGFAFPEMNLRMYVSGPNGPGIWFFSLDASQLLAVVGARAIFGLPYFRAEMSVNIRAGENVYFSERGRQVGQVGQVGQAKARIRIAKQGPITA